MDCICLCVPQEMFGLNREDFLDFTLKYSTPVYDRESRQKQQSAEGLSAIFLYKMREGTSDR